MPKRVLLHATAFLVLLPSTLAAAFLTLMGLAWSADGLLRGKHVVAAVLLLCGMGMGWFALFAGWRAYVAVLRRRQLRSTRNIRIALMLGALVSIFFIVASGGSLAFRLAFFGWPLIAIWPLWPYLKDENAA